MDSMASAIGVSVPVLRFLLCFAATIPVSFFHRFVPGGPAARHFYAAATGAFLSYLSFGLSSNLHFVVPMLLGYASMLLCRKYCGILTFFLAFGYLIGWWVWFFRCLFIEILSFKHCIIVWILSFFLSLFFSFLCGNNFDSFFGGYSVFTPCFGWEFKRNLVSCYSLALIWRFGTNWEKWSCDCI